MRIDLAIEEQTQNTDQLVIGHAAGLIDPGAGFGGVQIHDRPSVVGRIGRKRDDGGCRWRPLIR